MTERERGECICPHAERPLGRLYGVTMGRGIVRLSTTPGCPEHDSCHEWTEERRRQRTQRFAWSKPYCPVHGTRDCPARSRVGVEREDEQR